MPGVARLVFISFAAVIVLATTLATRMRFDHETQAPTVTSPPVASTVSGPIPVTFDLPERARSGSVSLVFEQRGGSTTSVALDDADGEGTHTLSVDPDDVGALGTVSGPQQLDDGDYAVRVRYADAAGNRGVSSEMLHFAIARGTIPGP